MTDVFLNKLRKSCLRLLSGFSYNWSITKKIGYSYTIVIGTTLIGIISGSLIAYYYELAAYKKLNLSYQQQYLLKDLENDVTRARLHPQRLIPILDNSVWLEFEKNRFLADVNHINQQLSEIENFANNHSQDLAMNSQTLFNLLKAYKEDVELYNKNIQLFWEEIESRESNDLPLNKLLAFLKQKEIINIDVEFERKSDELTQMIVYAEKQQQQASNSFNNARTLRLQLVGISILLSTAIAAMIALLTSRLIARPLQSVTNIARKITQESNFRLRAKINSHDEIGTLANSLNQLVEWVGDYTEALEISRQTLEQRVEERTHELQQAHHTLEQRVEERTQELKITLKELQETQGQLIQTEKMSSLGQMVAGIAHEINNPVNFIYGNIECADGYINDLLHLVNLYQQQYPDPDFIIADTIEEIDLNFISKDLVNLLASMKMGSQRIREIVLSLRNFSRLDEADMKDVDIHEGIDNTLLILNYRLKFGVQVIKEYGKLPLIECYPAQLNQVFMNIISNAIDALLGYSNQINKQITILTTKLDNNHIKVQIHDNGPGIPPEIIKRLFDPFFTTKPVGKGTGLGLSICYKIIEKHQGKIEVLSEPSQGTDFIIILPIKTELN
ncbi:ATP-binding protein [Anabaena sp. UHCC 0399]|uniref:sensor histidine kinase n=1 Tax=Anabaena sp. UHCC 0399 TaxID=3110238 RepID=UPI002B20D138|nr:ATP-binding protein [Anabaena sp. UHCC 0399]MEA5569293.1 ATP-binding protein [Anabaena sp. UHCC 0399]